MASRYCAKCGREVIAGKRFCKQCGHAVGEAAPAAAPDASVETVPVGEQIVSVCRNCGAAIAVGKPFCKKCGQAVSVTAVDTPAVAAAAVQLTPVKMPEAATKIPVLREGITATAGEAEVPYQAQFTQEDIAASKWEPVETAVPHEAASSGEVPAQANQNVLGNWPKAKIGLVIGIAAGVLMAAGGGWAWYAHMHRGVSSGSNSSTATPQPIAQGGSYTTPGTTAQSAKPPAGTAAVDTASAPVVAPQPALAPSPAPAAQNQPSSSNQPGRGNPVEPNLALNRPLGTPTTPPLPPSPPPPAQARSGVRHYQGPPVPHGGLVVFDNLPNARLKFTFDHAAWQLILKANPDGTKKATLISQAQGIQSSCDLGWELVE